MTTKKRLDSIENTLDRFNARLALVEVQSAGNRGLVTRALKEIEESPLAELVDVARVRIVQFNGLSAQTYDASPRITASGRPLDVKVGDIVSLEPRYGRRPVGVVVAFSKRIRESDWRITAIGGRVANKRDRGDIGYG